ncbi:MAG: RNA polymerase sigma factor, partial [Candidatus Cryptobacteroides sp.]
KASTFRGDRNNLMAWCYRIATNEALHILRKRSGLFRSLDSAGKELAEMVATEGGPDADKSEILFQQALMQLGTQQRIVFTLRYYDDLSYKQIEEITTGKSQNTLRANYHYAVNKIKEYLKENSI